MKYLRKFENEAAYSAYTQSENYVTPNVCLLKTENAIRMNEYVAPPMPAELEPIKFTVLQGSGTIPLRLPAAIYDSNNEPAIDYVEWSTDGETWNRTNYDVNNGNLIETDELQEGDVCYFRGSARTYCYNNNNYSYFLLSTGGGSGSGSGSGSGGGTTIEDIKVEGNIMSLLGTDTFGDYMNLIFFAMFYNCTNLSDTSDLILPATTLVDHCYGYMFSGCSSLTTAPTLPATTLADHCYEGMFYDCNSLTSAPALPATTLADFCYEGMFYCCTSLTTAPTLPATTLADHCYYQMFSDCNSLTSAPALPATTLADSCYSQMFYGCTSLTTAPTLPATTLADHCYYQMFHHCASLTTAPTLSATTLADSCYSRMFYGCSLLNSITMFATDISANQCLSYWVTNVAASGTFTKASSMTTLPTGDSGIPSGWTVVEV